MKSLSTIIFFCYLLTAQVSSAQGLKFVGNSQPIDKRTSYNVFDNETPCFKGQFDIDFDLALYPQTKIGYIIRIKNSDDKMIYNLFYDAQGQNTTFKFNKEGHNSLITIEMNQQELFDAHWFKMKIAFDLANDSLRLTINNQTFSVGGLDFPEKFSPAIVFGRSDYIIDVPTFAIKNLTVGNNKNYTFALREREGTIVHDVSGRNVGSVSNPEWMINDSYHWRFETSFASKTVAGTCYNPSTKEIYYFNRDAIHTYNVWSKQKSTQNFKNQCPVKLTLGTSFINTNSNKLYAYEVYYNTPSQDSVTMASLDLSTNRWEPETTQQLPTQLHHHSAYFDASNGRYTIFGGFGNMRYSNSFYMFDPAAQRWDQVLGLTGDVPFPRYFSSMGYLEKNNSIYIFGGMGNQSGEQVVGRNYFYDMYKIDLTTKRSTKLWEIQPHKINMVPVRGMILLDDTYFYTLCYPESFTDSFLRLYRFSLKDGSYKILGDSIPIHSDKITTNANLYYNAQLNNIYVTVQEFEDDIESEMMVYSLAFPPITAEELIAVSKTQPSSTLLWCVAMFCALAAATGYLLFRNNRAKSRRDADHAAPIDTQHSMQTSDHAKSNAVYLFGDFVVRDRNAKDITYMFSTRLKQTLCLIMQYSDGDGITSQRLSNLLWPDKPGDKVKNSRSVTINHLRKNLSELDGVELIHEKGCFKIVQRGFYCDYIECLEIMAAGINDDNIDEMTRIVGRGKFLEFSNEPLFDSFKEQLEQLLEPILLHEMVRNFDAKDYLNTISLAQAEFNIDPLNDDALAYMVRAMQRMKMTDEAQTKYKAFVAQYKNTIGSDYPHPLKSF